jgi:hypothetical protein
VSSSSDNPPSANKSKIFKYICIRINGFIYTYIYLHKCVYKYINIYLFIFIHIYIGSGDSRAYRWLEFNDSEVTEFTESRLEAECFGGKTKCYDYSADSGVNQVDIVNVKSAYMLVYRRVQPLSILPSPPSSSGIGVYTVKYTHICIYIFICICIKDIYV